jgi:hypothetical protein
VQAPLTIASPKDPHEVQAYAKETSAVINGELSFGYPVDPDDATATNGRKDNMAGSWVRVTIAAASFFVQGTAAGAAVTFTHNLNLPTAGTSPGGIGTSPNVTYEVKGYKSSGAHGPPGLGFRVGDTISASSIQLRPSCSHVPPNTITMIVWFAPAPPW